MSFLENLAAGCLTALAALVVLGLLVALFGIAFDGPDKHGVFAVAGAILLGSALIALALFVSKRDTPA